MKESEVPKGVEDFFIMCDVTARVGQAAGLSDELILTGFRNRLLGGQDTSGAAPEPGIMARARERGLPVRTFNEYKAAKRALGLAPAGKDTPASEPADQGAGHYTAEQKEQIRRLGKDPELLEKTRGAKNFTEYKQRKKAAMAGGGKDAA